MEGYLLKKQGFLGRYKKKYFKIEEGNLKWTSK